MPRLDRIYTRGGDGGETSLAGGGRVAKTSHRIEAIGAVDETNAAIGVARALCPAGEAGILAGIQNDLFDLGADLATPAAARGDGALRITAGQTTRLEQEIDRITARLSPLTSFVLPGGSPAAAALHLARTIARRAERRVCQLQALGETGPGPLHYLNRLSDLLFVLARLANDGGRADILWVPGAGRNQRPDGCDGDST